MEHAAGLYHVEAAPERAEFQQVRLRVFDIAKT